jgi:lipopolysaccharide export system permease protein
LFKDNYQMMNIRQLNAAIDTLETERERAKTQFTVFLKPYFVNVRVNADSIAKAANIKPDNVLVADTMNAVALRSLYQRALVNIRNVKGYASLTANDIETRNELLRRHEVEWHRKFTLSLACFLLFFIGAPLGAIIRKGGFGLPFVVSILFFVVYYMLTITGEKFAKQGSVSAVVGMWMSVAVLFPLGLWLTYKASRDSVLFNKEAYTAAWRRIVELIKRKPKHAGQSA